MIDFTAAQDEDFVEISIKEPEALLLVSDDQAIEDEDGMYAIIPRYVGTAADCFAAVDDHWMSEHLGIYVLSQDEFGALFEEDLALCVRGGDPSAGIHPGSILSTFDAPADRVSADGHLGMGQSYVTLDFFRDYGYVGFGPNAASEPYHIFFAIGD